MYLGSGIQPSLNVIFSERSVQLQKCHIQQFCFLTSLSIMVQVGQQQKRHDEQQKRTVYLRQFQNSSGLRLTADASDISSSSSRGLSAFRTSWLHELQLDPRISLAQLDLLPHRINWNFSYKYNSTYTEPLVTSVSIGCEQDCSKTLTNKRCDSATIIIHTSFDCTIEHVEGKLKRYQHHICFTIKRHLRMKICRYHYI